MNNLHHPLYPTVDGKPPKTPQHEKPSKKPSKSDANKYDSFASQSPSSDPNHHNNKFDFVNYDDELTHHPNDAQNSGPGPGFFNPSASKNQYSDYDSYGHGGNVNGAQQPPGRPNPNTLPFNPFQQNADHQSHQGQDKIPPELFNILGPNPQNLEPHIRIEQLLQHIQGADAGGGIHLPSFVNQQQPNGVNYPFVDHNAGAQPDIPGLHGQRPTGGHFISNENIKFIFMSLLRYLMPLLLYELI